MAVDRNKLFNDIKNGVTWDTGVVFNRTNGIPIDKWSIFKTYEDAMTYASSNPVAYPGQIVTVVPDDGESSAYIIMGDGSLKAVGSDAGMQSDWNQTDDTKLDYIKNKPTVMLGATAGADGVSGFVPAPKSDEAAKYLRGDGTWNTVETIATDDTLTKDGYAADAKITGDKITEIEAFIPIILTQAEYDLLVDGGTITLNGHEISFEENRVYMIKRFVTDKEV